MTDLKTRLIERISRHGPMSLAEYMTECLLHPDLGYYTQANPLGRDGDFITAPEISQMFGELLGLWLAQVWMDQGAPSEAILLELGPGRGTLMADALRATRAVPGFHDAMRLHLVEASPRLRDIQKEALTAFAPIFHDTLDTVPEAPLFVIANEFFDALPIRQFQRAAGDLWQERVVGLEKDALAVGLAPPAPLASLEHRLQDTETGMIVETCAPAEAIASELGRRVADHGGAAILIDYGGAESIGDTLQAVAGHQTVDPFADPGKADLTAHVAFGALARAASPARASALVPQGVFLERLGITARAQALAKNMHGPALDQHIAAHRRLTHPDEMGHLFRVLALVPDGAATPPGCSPWP